MLSVRANPQGATPFMWMEVRSVSFPWIRAAALLVLVGLPWLAGARLSLAEDEPEPPLVAVDEEPGAWCPALHPGPEINGSIGRPPDTDLIARVEVLGIESSVARVRLVETWYGAAPAPEIQVDNVREGLEPGRYVIELTRAHGALPGWKLIGSPLADTPANCLAAQAIGEARLAEETLSASAILIGREMRHGHGGDASGQTEDNRLREVRVERVVLGPAALTGQRVWISDEGLGDVPTRRTPLRAGSRIYFLGERGPGAEPPMNKPPQGRTRYLARRSLPVESLPALEQTLARRESYPLTKAVRRLGRGRIGDVATPVREIVFRGTVQQAIIMLGSDFDLGVAHAHNYMYAHAPDARSAVWTAIRKRVFDHRVAADRHRVLGRLLDALSAIECAKPSGALDRLLRNYLDWLDSDDAEEAAPGPYPFEMDEHGRTDVNRTLLRLLSLIGREASLRYAARIRSLRDSHTGAWRRELQLAMDFLAVEDSEDLMAALARSKDTTTSIERRLVEQGGTQGLFALSNAGTHIALPGAGGRVRVRTLDAWQGHDIETMEEVRSLAFSPDDQHLYVGGEGGASLQRHVVATGACDQVYEGHASRVDEMLLLDRGRVLASLSEQDDVLLFHDVRSGALLGRESTKGYALRRSPSRPGVWLSQLRGGPVYVPLPGRADSPMPPAATLPGAEARGTREQSSDGRWVCVANADVESWAADEGTLVLYERKADVYREAARVTGKDSHAFAHLAISPDGRFVATGGRNRTVRLYRTPDLRLIHTHRFRGDGPSDWDLKRIAFTSNARFLVAGISWHVMPGLLRTDALEEVYPWPHHGDDVANFFFSHDGREIRTIGRDGGVCRWEARRLAPIGRFHLPPATEVTAVHASAGLLLCFDHDQLRDQADNEIDWKDGRRAWVIDGRTGQIRSRFTLPRALAEAEPWWLGDANKLVLDTRGSLVHIDPRDGRVEATVSYDAARWGGAIEEDGRHLFRPDPVARNEREVAADRIDLLTGRVTRRRERPPRRISAREFGLVPGGRHFWFAGRGLRVFERRTLREVFHLPLNRSRILGGACSPDGRHIGLICREDLPPSVQRQLGTKETSMLRIFDLQTRTLLFAYPFHGRARRVAFSPDGKRVALLAQDDRLLLWELPQP